MSTEERKQQRENTPASADAHRELVRDHPLEESQKSYHTVLEQQIGSAEAELDRPATALLLSGLAAGLDIGFGPLLIAVNATLTQDVLSRPLQELINANLYAIGFVFVVVGRSELFTEHTTPAVLPVLARRSSVARLFRLWGLVLVANLAGCAAFAAFAVHLGPALGVIERSVFGEIARPFVDKPSWVIFASAIGAGWVMGMLAWLVTAARDTIAQIVIVWLATFIIGITKLHHSIAGSVEVLMGVFAGIGATPADYGRFIVWAVLGNAVGGVLFVALLKFGHVQQSAKGAQPERGGTR